MSNYQKSDLERVRHDELGDPQALIREVEESNRSANPELIARIFANANARRSRRVGEHREWRDRIAAREAAMRVRRAS